MRAPRISANVGRSQGPRGPLGKGSSPVFKIGAGTARDRGAWAWPACFGFALGERLSLRGRADPKRAGQGGAREGWDAVREVTWELRTSSSDGKAKMDRRMGVADPAEMAVRRPLREARRPSDGDLETKDFRILQAHELNVVSPRLTAFFLLVACKGGAFEWCRHAKRWVLCCGEMAPVECAAPPKERQER